MSAKLVAYEHVPLGFEMVIEKNEVKAWNLWWNVKLTDDPEAWDDEIRLVNRMQGRLNGLTLDQRLIRAQMAGFCRENSLFPQSIDVLCDEIGHGRFSNPIAMHLGCEGRGLLNSLGYNDPGCESALREGTAKRYSQALKKWLGEGCASPEGPTESKVFGFLGERTHAKKVFVEKLLPLLDSEEPSRSSLKELCEEECRKTQGESVLQNRGRPFGCFSCEGWQTNCGCSRSMILDAGLLCAGTSNQKEAVSGGYRRFVEENLLAYTVAVNSWLTDFRSDHTARLTKTRYVSRDCSLEIAERIHFSLGGKDAAKIWLTACLLKTIKDNQRWHKRPELIDDFPEATSWFGQTH